MRTQSQRDEQTVVIASAAGIFFAVTLFGLLAGGMIGLFVDVGDGLTKVGAAALLTLAAALTLSYLVRNGRGR